MLSDDAVPVRLVVQGKRRMAEESVGAGEEIRRIAAPDSGAGVNKTTSTIFLEDS